MVDTLSFISSDSEKYDEVPSMLSEIQMDDNGHPKLVRSNSMLGTKKSPTSSKWGHGWGIGLHRNNTKSSQSSGSTQRTQETQRSKSTIHTHLTSQSASSKVSLSRRPHIRTNLPTNVPSGSAIKRPTNEADYTSGEDTTEKLVELRRHMAMFNLDYYIVPGEDAHGSKYVAESDKRREFISGFTGTVGEAVVTMSKAYLITDHQYWLQAREQLDLNWTLVKAGAIGQPKDWVEWLVNTKEENIGIDARMISFEKGALIDTKIDPLHSKLIYPPRNLVDLVWKDKPAKSKAPIYIQPYKFTDMKAKEKLAKVREWIRQHPASVPNLSKAPSKISDTQVGTLITSLPSIAYLLNLRGSDIPHNPLFHAYLFVGLDRAVIFIDASKVTDESLDYLKSIGVERQGYTDVWRFLEERRWGEGKLLITPQTSHAISLVLTHRLYTLVPAFVETILSLKSWREITGLREAHLRDGASFVQFLAWLETKLLKGHNITEYEAAERLTIFRQHNKHFIGLSHRSISATGPNAALPHYIPKKLTSHVIQWDTPYLNDSSGLYSDGTCNTTRTVHFSHPSNEQCEAFTRVLQYHIAIDSAVFLEGMSGHRLDDLTRKDLWKDSTDYMHGSPHGFRPFLTVHEGPQSFNPLVPGHVVTNGPGFYNEGKWGIRIESALIVRQVETKGDFNDDILLGFERLTCVPIQTRMLKESMLTKEEKQWLKEHNQRCLEKLAPLLKDDLRAIAWLKREAEWGKPTQGQQDY
ncbi:peptidase M24, structural domain-containing protein [Collybia nuda]|uniref:Peptidase M24, structural domain-containing protein n=1 Tax=Collybia nuda TaxID=64659 RepID=A0A9P6CAY9_9AGAR|nr:peptidase M24, structural domain-containing protein [Collybia nuda]